MAAPLNPPSVSNIPEYNPADHADVHVQGYPRLAYFFSLCPRYLHLRRFAGLSIRTLLYQQHELCVLENKLLQLESSYYSDTEVTRRSCHKDYWFVTQGTEQEREKSKELRELLNNIIIKMKDYEEALVRFDKLGSKGWDSAKLTHVQRWLAQPDACAFALSGIDAKVWGSADTPSEHASDIIQVVKPSEVSLIGKFLQDKFLPWAHSLPEWLNILIFWSKKQPDRFKQYSRSNASFENASLALGNIATSLLVYIAMALLFFASAKPSAFATVLTVSSIATFCSLIFKNQQFVVMLATLCAVLVTLLANNDRPGEKHSTSPSTSN